MDKDITLEQEFDLVFKAHYSLVKNWPNRRFGRITPG